jgi:hypothetical protein
MDEIDLVANARPAVADYPADDRAAARARLLAAAAKPSLPDARRLARARRRPPGLPGLARRAAIAGGLAIAVTITITISQQLGPGSTPVATPTANAAEVARHAAMAARNARIQQPRPHQWVYYKAWVVPGKTRGLEARGNHSRLVEKPAPDPYVAEWWVRHGQKPREATAVVFAKGSPPYFGLAAGGRYLLLRSLPTDPDRLLAVIYQEVQRYPDTSGHSVHYRAFQLIGGLLGGLLPPPDLQAALYEAMAKIPGVTAAQEATDAVGRHGVALARIENRIRDEVILDKATYEYLGRASIVASDHYLEIDRPRQAPLHTQWLLREGEVLYRTAQLRIAFVDAPRQRPRDVATGTGIAPGP